MTKYSAKKLLTDGDGISRTIEMRYRNRSKGGFERRDERSDTMSMRLGDE